MNSQSLRCSIYCDHDNLVYGQAREGVQYEELIKYVEARGLTIIRATTYMAINSRKERVNLEYRDSQNKHRSDIRNSGFKVVTRQLKHYKQVDGSETQKGNVDLMITIDAIQETQNVDYVFIGTGDGDFFELVSALQSKGKRVIGFGFDFVSKDLMRTTDEFITIENTPSFVKTVFPEFKTRESSDYLSTPDVINAGQIEGIKNPSCSQLDPEALRVQAVESKQSSAPKARPDVVGLTEQLVTSETDSPNKGSQLSGPGAREKGKIIHWNPVGGYGFIEPFDNWTNPGTGLYFHVTNVAARTGERASNEDLDYQMDENTGLVSFKRFGQGSKINAVVVELE